MQDNCSLNSISLSNGLKLHRGDTILCTQDIEFEQCAIGQGEVFTIEDIEYDSNQNVLYASISADEADLFDIGLFNERGLDGYLSSGTLRIVEKREDPYCSL